MSIPGQTRDSHPPFQHLVGPLGFSLDDAKVKRAGLDYWKHVDLHVHDDWQTFRTTTLPSLGRRFFFTKFGDTSLLDVDFMSDGLGNLPKEGDEGRMGQDISLIFGSETKGLFGLVIFPTDCKFLNPDTLFSLGIQKWKVIQKSTFQWRQIPHGATISAWRVCELSLYLILKLTEFSHLIAGMILWEAWKQQQQIVKKLTGSWLPCADFTSDPSKYAEE